MRARERTRRGQSRRPAPAIAALLLAVHALAPAPAIADPLPGQIAVAAGDPRWLARRGGGPIFLAGPGDPEGFLYRGTRSADGTRRGDQRALIEKLRGSGANAIYVMAVRSHGGDGDASENPFVDSDPARGLDPELLEQWESWFGELDRAGVAVFFIVYDDGSKIWDGDAVGPEERAFLRGLVERFRHHRGWIWCVAEEWSEAYSAARVRAIAAEIRAADEHAHPIAVHARHGLDFSDFADDPHVDQFAIQYNVKDPGDLHDGVVRAWRAARSRYNLNMAEAADYGGGAVARRKDWAVAMGGAYVMRLGMDVASTPRRDLEDMGRLVRFMEASGFHAMAPHDESRHGGAEFVLAEPGRRWIAYAWDAGERLGLRDLPAGTYRLTWFSPASGATVVQDAVRVQGGEASWPAPPEIGREVALLVERTGDPPRPD